MLAALHYTGEGKLAAVKGHMLLHPALAGGRLAVHLAAFPQAGVGACGGVQEGGHMAQLGVIEVGVVVVVLVMVVLMVAVKVVEGGAV